MFLKIIVQQVKNNACLDIADVVTKNLGDYGWEVLPHATFSPDMRPPDFNLFLKLKDPTSGRVLLFWKSFLPSVPKFIMTHE